MSRRKLLFILVILATLASLLTACGGGQPAKEEEGKPEGETPGRALASATIETIAGSGEPGNADGVGTEAQFNWPMDVAVDDEGNIYVSDRENRRVAKITPDGTVTTITGGNPLGDTDGSLKEARFATPWGIQVGPDGRIYVADTDNAMLRVVIPDEDKVATITDGFHAFHIAFDPPGYVLGGWGMDRQMVVRINLDTGERETIAGSGASGHRDGPAEEARFAYTSGFATDPAGNIYVSEGVNVRLITGNQTIRKISPDGQVTTVAGGYAQMGFRDGQGDQALFKYPVDVAAAQDGTLFVADAGNNCIRQITPDGTVTTVAGVCGEPGDFADGPVAEARFKNPQGVALDGEGNLIVADTLNHCIRRIVFH